MASLLGRFLQARWQVTPSGLWQRWRLGGAVPPHHHANAIRCRFFWTGLDLVRPWRGACGYYLYWNDSHVLCTNVLGMTMRGGIVGKWRRNHWEGVGSRQGMSKQRPGGHIGPLSFSKWPTELEDVIAIVSKLKNSFIWSLYFNKGITFLLC